MQVRRENENKPAHTWASYTEKKLGLQGRQRWKRGSLEAECLLEVREDCSEDRKAGAKPGGHGEGSSQQRKQKTYHWHPVDTARSHSQACKVKGDN